MWEEHNNFRVGQYNYLLKNDGIKILIDFLMGENMSPKTIELRSGIQRSFDPKYTESELYEEINN